MSKAINYKPKSLSDLMDETIAVTIPKRNLEEYGALDIVEIEIERLIPYTDKKGKPQTFSTYDAVELQSLVESISLMDIHTPIIVSPKPNGSYMILAGHNRTEASKLAGKKTIPAIVRDVSPLEAHYIMLSTNIDSRLEHKPSELALACLEYMEIAKEIQSTSETDTGELVANEFGFSRRKVFQMIKLVELEPTLLSLVDSKIIPMTVGVELTKLEEEKQTILSDFLKEHAIDKLTAKHGKELLSCDFTDTSLQEIFGLIKKMAPPPSLIRVGNKTKTAITNFFELKGITMTDEEIAETVTVLLEKHYTV